MVKSWDEVEALRHAKRVETSTISEEADRIVREGSDPERIILDLFRSVERGERSADQAFVELYRISNEG